MPKRLCFLQAIVLPLAKVFLSPSLSCSSLRGLSWEAIRHLWSPWQNKLQQNTTQSNSTLGPWGGGRSFGNPSLRCTSTRVLLSLGLGRTLSSAFRPAEVLGCLLSACCLKTSFPLVRGQSCWLGTSVCIYRETLEKSSLESSCLLGGGNLAWAIWFHLCSKKQGFELANKQSCFKDRWLRHQPLQQRNDPNYHTFNQAIVPKAVQNQRVRQWLQKPAKILTVHNVCQPTGQSKSDTCQILDVDQNNLQIQQLQSNYNSVFQSTAIKKTMCL